MAIKAVLFDLDGTLLPMDQDVFIKAYFGGLSMKMAPLGYEPQELIKAVWAGTEAMIRNDGEGTNEEAFWKVFCSVFGEKAREDSVHLESFYQNEFDGVQKVCSFNENAPKIVRKIKDAGVKVVLATNPIFPAIATRKRISWAGLSESDFQLYTTYENCRFCKPNLKYYEDILKEIGEKPEDCLMVGNDVSDDMVAERLGMKTFLLTDCLINKNGADVGRFNNGSFKELEAFIEENI